MCKYACGINIKNSTKLFIIFFMYVTLRSCYVDYM
jgi:hypothetical protein